MSRPRIGELLVARGLVGHGDMELALDSARATGGRVASQLLALGIVDEGPVVEVLAATLRCTGVDLSQSVLVLAHLPLIPREVAQLERILPLDVRGDRLLLATADPSNTRVLDEVQLISGLQVVPVVALATRLDEVVAAAYTAWERGEATWRGESTGAVIAPRLVFHEPPEEGGESAAAAEDVDGIEIEIDDGTVSETESIIDALFDDGTKSEEIVGQIRARTGPRRVLVVDDDPDVVTLVTTALRAKGHRLDVARNGREALDKAIETLPDLVLLDANLPELHGFEVCRKLKANRRLEGVPVMMLTGVYRGWRFAEDAREAYGADDYLEKPFRLEDLVRRVEHLLLQSVGEPEDRAEAESLYGQGVAALNEGRTAESVALLERSVKADAFSSRSWYQLARALQASGEAFRAIEAYERSIELMPRHFPALRSLAALYQQKGFRRKATETWERALGAAPDEATRQRIRSTLLARY